MRKAPFLLLALALPAAANPPVGEKETGTTTGPARRGNETGPGGIASGPGARRPPLNAPGKNVPAADVAPPDGVPLKGAAPEKTGTVNDDESGVVRRDSEKRARESARKLADALKVSPPPAEEELPPAKLARNQPADNGPRTREGLDLVAAASTGFAPLYREAGLRAARGPDGTLELVDRDGNPATPLAVELLRKKIDAEPRALIRRPDLYQVIPADDYKNLVAKLSVPGAHESPAFRHIGRSEHDFIWTRSCARVSGECNPHAVEREYKERQEVAPETLRNVAAHVGKGGFDGAQPKPELAAQPQAQPPSGWLKGVTQAWSLLKVEPERTRELGLQRLQEAKELTDDGSSGFWLRRGGLNLSGNSALLLSALSDRGNWSLSALYRAQAQGLAAELAAKQKALRDEPGLYNAWALGQFYFKLSNPGHAAVATVAEGVVNDFQGAWTAAVALNEKRDAARALDLAAALGKVGLNFVGLGAGAAIRQTGARVANAAIHAVEINAPKAVRTVLPAQHVENRIKAAAPQLRANGFADEGFESAMRNDQPFELRVSGDPTKGPAQWIHNHGKRHGIKVFIDDAAFKDKPNTKAFAINDQVFVRSEFIADFAKNPGVAAHELQHALNFILCHRHGGAYCSRLIEFRALDPKVNVGPDKFNHDFYSAFWRGDEFEAVQAGLWLRAPGDLHPPVKHAFLNDFIQTQQSHLRSARAAAIDTNVPIAAVEHKSGYTHARVKFTLEDGRPISINLPLPKGVETDGQIRRYMIEMIDIRLRRLEGAKVRKALIDRDTGT